MSVNAILAHDSQSLSALRGRGSRTGSPPRQSPVSIWAVAAVAMVLTLAYAPNLRDLYSIWNDDPNYSHGKLVIPIALFILWRRLSETSGDTSQTAAPATWWGWIFLTAVLVVRAVAYEQNGQWVETATLLPVLACVTWTLGGWPLLRRIWPAIIFLVFLLPLPRAVNDMVSLPLQRLAATGSCFLLQLSGLWAVQEGNIINLTTPRGPMPLDVALACNGLRMLTTMIATITATIILIPLPTWKRIVLLVSTVPIGLLSNMIRIVATGWLYYEIAGPKAKEWAHDLSGWLMMPLALALVGLELRLMSWLVPERTVEEEEDQKLVIPLIHQKASGKKPRQNADLDELV